jgi:hypothetical protein
VAIRRIELSFDCDYDHPMENVLIRQTDAVQPYCATGVIICAGGKEIAALENNHQARATLLLDEKVQTNELTLIVKNENQYAPAALFEVRCYAY